MGMYTEFHFNSELKTDTPQQIIDLLNSMINFDKRCKILPNHPLFKTARWFSMLVSASYYFDACTNTTLQFDEISDAYFLCIRCNLKNYDNEIQKFVDWISPYLKKEEKEFLGFMRQETEETPTLIFHKNQFIDLHEIDFLLNKVLSKNPY